MRKILTLLSVLMLGFFAVHAQSRTISGKVIDKNARPVEGASIQIKKTSVGTVTNKEGSFSIAVKNDDVLYISSLNYDPKEVVVSPDMKNDVSIVLNYSENSITEVVVTALGVRREKRMLTYATQEVKGSALVDAKQDNIVNGLSGKIAGV